MSHSSEYPDFFAGFYDVIYDKVRHDADHDYFLNKMIQVNDPVLEVGVGTGRFFKEALNRGVDIYGIDISPSMIKILKGKLPQKDHHRVAVQDICKLDFNRKFDLIVAPFRVFMHLLSVTDQFIALEKVHEHLNPDGQFIFDLFVCCP
jgi:SAM-dependent methyltransferase